MLHTDKKKVHEELTTQVRINNLARGQYAPLK